MACISNDGKTVVISYLQDLDFYVFEVDPNEEKAKLLQKIIVSQEMQNRRI